MILIGHRGAGKTTLGRRLAQEQGLPFIDTDALIEAEIGCTVRDYFSKTGEVAFREIESRVIQSLRPTDAVIAVGGGAILDPLNVAHLRTLGKLFYVHCSPDLLRERDPRFDLATYERRLPIYCAIADETINL